MLIIKKIRILLFSLFLGMMLTSCVLLELFPKPPEKSIISEMEGAESEKNSYEAGNNSLSDAEKATVSETEDAESEKESHKAENDSLSDAEKATVSETEDAESEKEEAKADKDDASAIDPNAYKIGSGDVLEIVTWKEPDFSKEISVRIDGKITFPLLDDLQAAGLTPLQLKKVIEEQLMEYVSDPRVTVTVKGPMSQKFYILGEVSKTGEYNLLKNLTILQAFALAGGFTEWASKKEIILVRHEDGKEKVIRINYKNIAKGKDFSQNIFIKANDTIIVP